MLGNAVRRSCGWRCVGALAAAPLLSESSKGLLKRRCGCRLLVTAMVPRCQRPAAAHACARALITSRQAAACKWCSAHSTTTCSRCCPLLRPQLPTGRQRPMMHQTRSCAGARKSAVRARVLWAYAPRETFVRAPHALLPQLGTYLRSSHQRASCGKTQRCALHYNGVGLLCPNMPPIHHSNRLHVWWLPIWLL